MLQKGAAYSGGAQPFSILGQKFVSLLRFSGPRLAQESGERGRNRTFNLLIYDQQPINQWFQRFPKDFRGQEWADLGEFVP